MQDVRKSEPVGLLDTDIAPPLYEDDSDEKIQEMNEKSVVVKEEKVGLLLSIKVSSSHKWRLPVIR